MKMTDGLFIKTDSKVTLISAVFSCGLEIPGAEPGKDPSKVFPGALIQRLKSMMISDKYPEKILFSMGGNKYAAKVIFHDETGINIYITGDYDGYCREVIGRLTEYESNMRRISSISHDFNNILTVLKGYLDLIPKDDSIQEYIEGAETCFKSAALLTRKISDITRLGVITRKKGIHDLGIIIRDTVSLMKKVTLKDISMEVSQEEGEEYLILADKISLEQVIMNIIKNSMDAIEFSGEIHISLKNAGDTVTLAIADNGSGIPAEHLDSIFLPFYTTKSPGSGSGLGLFSAKSILEGLGGDIRAKSSHAGTVMTISLPSAGDK